MIKQHTLLVVVPVSMFLLPIIAAQAQPPGDQTTASGILEDGLPGFRLAEPTDFVQELQEVAFVDSATQSVFRADFDQDGNDDWAMLVVNESSPEYRLYYVLSQDTEYRFVLLLSRTVDAPASNGLIRNAIFLKEPGDRGIAGRSYASIAGNPLDPDNFTREFGRERAARTQEYESVPAVEAWTGPAKVDNPDGHSLPDSGIAYCSETWYYRRSGEFASFGVCD